MKVILSLCDYSGVWSAPYERDGYEVIRVDLKHGQDVRLAPFLTRTIHGILAAPPCTDFAVSGARWWADKGAPLAGLALVDACLRAVALYRPVWWALENPVGRLKDWIGPASWSFHPYEFAGYSPTPDADRYTKKTLIWGTAKRPPQKPLAPVMFEKGGKRGSWMWANLGGKSERTKELRSQTPLGFAEAFRVANP